MAKASKSETNGNEQRILFPLQSPFSDRKRAFFWAATKFATIVREFLDESEVAELDSLLAMLDTRDDYPFRKCELKDCDGDLSKRWHVEYYAFNTVTNKLERVRFYLPAKYKSRGERMAYARDFMAEVDFMLKSGKTITKEAKAPLKKEETVWELMDVAYACKKNSIQNAKTLQGFEMTIGLVREWLSQSVAKDLRPNELTRAKVFELIDWFQDDFEERNGYRIKNRTFNNYKNNILSIFSELVTRGYFEKNPIAIIKDREVKESANFPLDKEKKDLILHYFERNKQWTDLYFCQFIYYTLARPTEIIKLKRKNIQVDKIMFEGGISKNKKTKFIPITAGCKALLDKMEVWDKAPETYLFSRKELSTYEPTPDNWYGKRHTEALQKLGLHGDYSLYSWKDTGACDMYLATKDIMFVKDMCRHSSVSHTEVYLRSMGILLNNREAENAPIL